MHRWKNVAGKGADDDERRTTMTAVEPGPNSSMSPRGRQTAAGAEIGALIGAGFGLLFLIINTVQFSTLGRTLVIAVGVIVFVGIAVLAVRGLLRKRGGGGRLGESGERGRREPPFGRAYWIIVLIEAVLLFAGTRLLASLGHPELGVAWVAVVVGTHFFALGWVFGLDRFHVLATVVTLCGTGGFIAFFAAAPAFIPVISGVISGFVLLAFAMWALIPTER
ncbi:hypothetical protein [Brevibacterium sp. JSBI002]|uniref:hypothetical protein n=1 Tax=Brevibacterium sp. JSBI002 TaxID=2886045 RepID=UPI00222F8972|nr:hypothetical protein [Brevibacterium sp. JSBI002]UZD62316.1 hypothetical protein LJ362_00115 [Brevibacterium sp. JSBI002]